MCVCVCVWQYDDKKLDDLLKEVAETEVPADAPKAPPSLDEVEMADGNDLLPSQRDTSMC